MKLPPSIHLRTATRDDRQTLFDWRNDPWLLSFSESRRTIQWDEHVVWFNRSLESDDCAIFIIDVEDGESIGSVRLDREGRSSARISVYIVRQFTGRGRGPQAISEACRRGFERWPVRIVRADVRANNNRSIQAFEKSGFVVAADDAETPEDHVTMILRRDTTL